MDKKFEYTYSAVTEDERGEIENIRSRYLAPKKESGLERLRYLDKKVKNPPLILALSIGIVGANIFGLGITFSIEWGNLYAGIPLGALGAALMVVNSFIHTRFLESRKKKYGKEILELSEKLLKGNKSDDNR